MSSKIRKTKFLAEVRDSWFQVPTRFFTKFPPKTCKNPHLKYWSGVLFPKLLKKHMDLGQNLEAKEVTNLPRVLAYFLTKTNDPKTKTLTLRSIILRHSDFSIVPSLFFFFFKTFTLRLFSPFFFFFFFSFHLLAIPSRWCVGQNYLFISSWLWSEFSIKSQFFKIFLSSLRCLEHFYFYTGLKITL